MKKYIVLLLLLTAFCVGAYAQTSWTGRFVADDDESVYQYFEFAARGTVRIGLEFMGYESSIRATYRIEDGYVIITAPDGGIVELEIIDGNTLLGDDIGMWDVTFIRER